ncbi:hypothetical protein PG988_006509 [Apiospora saccharicola]
MSSQQAPTTLSSPVTVHPSQLIHPSPQRQRGADFFATTLLPKTPLSNQVPVEQDVAPPTPTQTPKRSLFDPRYQQQLPSTLLYYTKDRDLYDKAEHYRTNSLFWQQAYMKSHEELAQTVLALESRLEALTVKTAQSIQFLEIRANQLDEKLLAVQCPVRTMLVLSLQDLRLPIEQPLVQQPYYQFSPATPVPMREENTQSMH